MINPRWITVLLGVMLLLAGGAMIIYVSLLDQEVLLVNLTLIIVLFGLSTMTFAALTLLLREIAIRLHQESVHGAREQALAEHRRFLRRLDHELKNPVTALRAGLGSLMLTGSASQKEIVRTLDDEVVRLSYLVNDLRKLAELEVGTLETHRIVLESFVEEVVDLDAERIQAQGRDFRLENRLTADDPKTITGDQSLLLLAVHNLLDNALKYTVTGDSIVLQFRVENSDFVIRVGDTGCGIASDELEMVWEELYRGKSPQPMPGYGIGLALVKSIVERHEGEAGIVSQPDIGTTVTLRLPVK